MRRAWETLDLFPFSAFSFSVIKLYAFFIIMPYSRTVSIVGCHAEGEVGDVIIGGVLDVPGETMYEKLEHCLAHKEDLRLLLLNEPRGRSSMNTNLVLQPCDPRADAGFLIMESEE